MDATMYKYIAVAVTMFATALGAGYGLSHVFATWLNAISRNPAAEAKLKLPGFVGFAGTELVLLLGFVVSALLLFAV